LKEGSKILFEILGQSPTHEWSLDEQMLLDEIAGELSLVLENALLSERIQLASDNLENFYQAATELNVVQNFNDVLTILRKHTLFRDVDKLLTLNLFNRPWIGDDIPEWNLPVARWTSLKHEDFSTRHSMRAFPAYRLISPDHATVIEDVANDPRLDRNTRTIYMDRFQAKSVIFVPIVFTGKWIGMIDGVFGKPTQFQADQVRHLMAVANLAAVAIQCLKNLGLAEHRAQEIQRRSQEIILIHRVATAISTSPNLQEAMQFVGMQIAESLSVQRVKIAILDEERKSMVIRVDYPGTPGDTRGVGFVIPVEENPTIQQIMTTRKLLAIPDAQASPLTSAIHAPLRQHGIHCMAVLPLLFGDQVIGMVELDFLEKGRRLTPEEMRLLEIILFQSAAAIQNALLSK
jgi:GAF domain-containing protein